MKRLFFSRLFFILYFSSSLCSLSLKATPAPTPSTVQKIGNKISSLFSYENQKIAIAAYKAADILMSISLIYSALSASGSAQPLDALPEEIETALNKMGMKKEDVRFYQAATKNIGYASALGNVTIDPEFYQKATRDERLMVIGHELTHIRDHHIAKKMAAGLTIYGLSNMLIKYSNKYINTAIKKSCQSDLIKQYPMLVNALEKVRKGSKLVLKSPLFKFFLTEYTLASLSRYFEKSADLESVKALGCSQGGVSFFSSFIEKSDDRSWFSFLHPRTLFLNLKDTLGFSSHPECSERVKYLSAL